MRIITYNANMKFREKQKIVKERIDPDILVVQECENPKKFSQIFYPYFKWIGENPNKGLAIFSKYKIDKLQFDGSSKFFLPVLIKDILVVGVWTQNDLNERENRYIGQVYNFITKNKSLMRGNKYIFLGDFNWNKIWDKNPDGLLTGNLSEVISIFKEKNIKSIYHDKFVEKFGQEKRATFFLYKKLDKLYHIDYIFASKDLLNKTKNVEVCDPYKWLEFSDHVPLIWDWQ